MVKEKYLKVKVKTRSKKDRVEEKEGEITIFTKEPARDNEANFAVINLLSYYFNIPKRNITIKHGLKSKTKTICIVDEIKD
jgi:uncharacterized protein YggU (UPF0235/DUF167 family)